MDDKIIVALEPNQAHALAMLAELAEEKKYALSLSTCKNGSTEPFFYFKGVLFCKSLHIQRQYGCTHKDP